jgi:NCAIR mutase (PurE)-related protein
MVDHHRALRSGHPETIFSPGKTVDQIVGIARRLLEKTPISWPLAQTDRFMRR